MSVGIDVGDRSCRMIGWRGSVPDNLPGGTIPSICAVGIEKFLVGKEAAKELDTKHANVAKFPISELRKEKKIRLRHPKGGQRDMAGQNMLAALLSQMNDRVMKRMNNEVAHLTLCIPPGLTGFEKRQLKVSASAAGFDSMDIITTAQAAVVHWSTSAFKVRPGTRGLGGSMAHKPVDMNILVVDAGERFTSVSVVNLKIRDAMAQKSRVLGCSSFRYGGHDVDKRLIPSAPVVAGVPPNVVADAVERAKKELNSLRETVIRIKEATKTITHAHLSVAAAPLLRRIGAASRALLAQYPCQTALLIGGSCRIVDINQLVTKELRLRVEVEDYDFAAAYGASRWANAQIERPVRDIQFHYQDSTAGHHYYAIAGVLDQGTPVIAPGAEAYEILVLDPEDEAEDPYDPRAALPYCELPIENDPEEQRWLIFEQIAGSRPPLTPQEVVSFVREGKPKPDAESAFVEKTVKKRSGGPLGLQFLEWKDAGPTNQGALEATYVQPGSDADKAGIRALAGWRLSSINGRTINTNNEVGHLMKEKGTGKMTFRFYRDGLPAAAGDNEGDDVSLIGWAWSGASLQMCRDGTITGLENPRPLVSEEELMVQLEADADHAKNLREFSETRNALEEAVLTIEAEDLTPDDLKDVCPAIEHYIALANAWIEWNDPRNVKPEEMTQLSSFIATIIEAYRDDDSDLGPTLEIMESDLNKAIPASIPGSVIRRLGRESRWKLLAAKRTAILEKLTGGFRKARKGASAFAKLTKSLMQTQQISHATAALLQSPANVPISSPKAGPRASPRTIPNPSPKHNPNPSPKHNPHTSPKHNPNHSPKAGPSPVRRSSFGSRTPKTSTPSHSPRAGPAKAGDRKLSHHALPSHDEIRTRNTRKTSSPSSSPERRRTSPSRTMPAQSAFDDTLLNELIAIHKQEKLIEIDRAKDQERGHASPFTSPASRPNGVSPHAGPVKPAQANGVGEAGEEEERERRLEKERQQERDRQQAALLISAIEQMTPDPLGGKKDSKASLRSPPHRAHPSPAPHRQQPQRTTSPGRPQQQKAHPSPQHKPQAAQPAGGKPKNASPQQKTPGSTPLHKAQANNNNNGASPPRATPTHAPAAVASQQQRGALAANGEAKAPAQKATPNHKPQAGGAAAPKATPGHAPQAGGASPNHQRAGLHSPNSNNNNAADADGGGAKPSPAPAAAGRAKAEPEPQYVIPAPPKKDVSPPPQIAPATPRHHHQQQQQAQNSPVTPRHHHQQQQPVPDRRVEGKARTGNHPRVPALSVRAQNPHGHDGYPNTARVGGRERPSREPQQVRSESQPFGLRVAGSEVRIPSLSEIDPAARSRPRKRQGLSRSPLYPRRVVQVSPASPMRRSGSPPILRKVPPIMHGNSVEPDPAPCRWGPARRKFSPTALRRQASISPSPQLIREYAGVKMDVPLGRLKKGWATAR
eukprot:gene22220-34096_t